MKNIIIKAVLFSGLILSVQSCKFDELVDPNKPSLEDILTDATKSQLNNVVTGALSQMRTDLNIYIDAISVMGRDYYRFSGSDPRWTTDMLKGVSGNGVDALDNNAFYTTRHYGARYRSVKNANILIQATQNSTKVTDEEKQGYFGFAKTVIAHELLMVLNQSGENGIRIDVADPDNLGPIVSKTEALQFIADQLDAALVNMDAAGPAFAFELTSGYSGFNTPVAFKLFINALAARVAAYREDFPSVLTYLNDSFLDVNGSLSTGVYHTFSAGSGDQLNNLFLKLGNNGENRLAHPGWVADGEVGDTRLAKAVDRGNGNEVINDDLTGTHDVNVFTSNVSPFTIIRNEELFLLLIEAQAQTNDLVSASANLDTFRGLFGLPGLNLNNKEAIIDEMLNQRRYSLFAEGHRWIDMRRYNKLGDVMLVPIDRPGDVVHTKFPIPADENI